MRLIRSDSPEVARCLASTNCVWARQRLLPLYVAGCEVILLLVAAIWMFRWTCATRLGGALLIVWSAGSLWRSAFSKRNWVMASCAEELYFRLFSHRGPRSRAGNEPEVMALRGGEVASLSIKTVEVFIFRAKPHVREWLVIEPRPGTQVAVAEQFERSSPPIYGCDLYKEWFIRSKSGNLWIPWLCNKPPLRTLLSEIASQSPNLTIAAEDRSELDLRRLYRKPEPEQRKVLARARRIGFAWACERVLRRNPYKRMSRGEAREYLSSIEIDADRETAT